MGKKKGNKKQQQIDVDVSDKEDSQSATDVPDKLQDSVARVNKKGKKKKRDEDDWENEVQRELETINSPSVDDSRPSLDENGGPKINPLNNAAAVTQEVHNVDADEKFVEKPESKKASKKSQKKGKKKDDDNWEDDVLNEIAQLDAPDTSHMENKDKDTKSANNKNLNDKVVEVEKAKKMKQSSETIETDEKDDNESTPSSKNVGEEPLSNRQKKEMERKRKEEERKKKKKGVKPTEEEKPVKKKPNKAMLAAMKETLQKQKEEEERFKKEEEERIRKEEEAERLRLEEIERERLKKEKKKQDKKDRIKRLKAEGNYLTPAQKELQRRRQAYLETLKEQGYDIPGKTGAEAEKIKKPKYEKKKKKNQAELVGDKEQLVESLSAVDINGDSVKSVDEELAKDDIVVEVVQEQQSEDDFDWEKIAEDDMGEDHVAVDNAAADQDDNQETDETSSEDDESEDENTSAREKAMKRIEDRRRCHEQNRSIDSLRAPVICVMGHVDTGKTKILDKLRHTHVQDGEAGGITQQIGATNVPVYAIEEQTKMVKNFDVDSMKIPGLLVIDTPGHESFSNLRSRGSSNCDMAILVVDIMHGLEPQTIESIKMLRKRKTPFVVALNKIDRLYEWQKDFRSDVEVTIRKQKRYVQDEFDARVKEVVVQFAQEGLNVKLFYENDDPKTWISMVPTSAHSGDGMGNLIALVVQLCQTMLAKRLSFSEQLQCTVLEVKGIQGLGTTVDVILTNGRLKYGDTIVLAGTEGPIVTHIKGLLMPQPLKELRVKNAYDTFNEIKAAQGVKILAKDMDKALAGTSLLVAVKDDEIEILKDEVQAEVDAALKNIKLQERGVFVQASTLGSLEALLEFLKTSKIPYAGIGIGPIHKRDVMKASVMLEHDSQWAVILAFDVKVEREAGELAESLGVRIFTADIIYHLFDAFMQHREELKKQKQEEYRQAAVFPCKLRILPNHVFKSRDPIVVGVQVESGQLRLGTPICVPSKEFLSIGTVTSMEVNHKPVDVATKSQEVCIKIEGTPGDAPKMVGRHFEETDMLVSKISRESIDILKDWFRDEMNKTDWQLIIELKKLFEII